MGYHQFFGWYKCLVHDGFAESVMGIVSSYAIMMANSTPAGRHSKSELQTRSQPSSTDSMGHRNPVKWPRSPGHTHGFFLPECLGPADITGRHRPQKPVQNWPHYSPESVGGGLTSV